MSVLQEWRRHRAMRPWLARRRVVLETILQLVPSGTPYWYDAALSFLQPGEIDFHHPARVDLFFHDPESFHLAVDVLGPDSRPHYRDAKPFISRKQWEIRRAQLEYRAWVLGEYHSPYLVVTDDEAVDPVSLASRIRILVPKQEIRLP
jgi:hypothetical protein